MSNLLGGNSKQSSQNNSYNQAYPGLQTDLNPTIQAGAGASGLLQQLLTGTGGDASYDNYKGSTGFQQQLDAGSQAITDNAASRGLLQSGATGKALVNYGNQLGNQNYNSFLQNLISQSQLGNQAAGTLAGAGQVVNASSNGKSKTGLGL